MTNMKILFLVLGPLYVLSFLLTLSSGFIYTLWLGVEMNLIAFIGLLNLGKFSALDTCSMKYFICQALGSMLLMGALFLFLTPFFFPTASSYLFTLSLLLKLGMFPFHWWFISFVASSNLWELWFVSVPQKFLPLYLLLMFPNEKTVGAVSLILGVLCSVVGGLKTTRLTLVLGYSSVMNSSWFLVFLNDFTMIFLGLFIYGLSLFIILATMKEGDNYLVSSATSSKSWSVSISQILAFLNLAGVPPFFNMWAKFLVFSQLMIVESFSLLLLFLFSSAGFLYIYSSYSIWGSSLSKDSKISWASEKGTSFISWALLLSFSFFFF